MAPKIKLQIKLRKKGLLGGVVRRNDRIREIGAALFDDEDLKKKKKKNKKKEGK